MRVMVSKLSVFFIILFAFPSQAREMESIHAGYGHSCGKMAGELYCWGWNYYGQLGNGTKLLATGPKKVKELGGRVSQVDLGISHSCAVVDGGVQCWGANVFGELGIGSREQKLTPQWVIGLGPNSGVTQVAVNGKNTCAIVNEGLMCWGQDWWCLLGRSNCKGRSSEDMATTPEWVIAEGQGVSDVALGEMHACAVQNSGVVCWGSGLLGKLGDGRGGDRFVNQPSPVLGLEAESSVRDLTVGSTFSCAIVENRVACWGKADYLGIGSDKGFFSTPQWVKGLPKTQPLQIESRENHTCASFQSGEIYCWGLGAQGQIGNGKSRKSLLPQRVTKLPQSANISSLSLGHSHSCAVVNSHAKCWGWNGFCQVGSGQCGTQDSAKYVEPVDVK